MSIFQVGDRVRRLTGRDSIRDEGVILALEGDYVRIWFDRYGPGREGVWGTGVRYHQTEIEKLP